MFKISPIQDPNVQSALADKCSTVYRDGAFAYSMIDNDSGEIMGFSQFEIKEGCGYIYDLKPRIGYSDNEAMFILGRATMNFIDMCGAHTLTASPEAADETLLRAIGLRATENGNYHCDMTGFFDGSHCSGHK